MDQNNGKSQKNEKRRMKREAADALFFTFHLNFTRATQ